MPSSILAIMHKTILFLSETLMTASATTGAPQELKVGAPADWLLPWRI